MLKYLLIISLLGLVSCDADFVVTPDLSGLDSNTITSTITVFIGVLDGIEYEFYFDVVEPLTGYTCLSTDNVTYNLYSQTDEVNAIVGTDSLLGTCDPFTYTRTTVVDSTLPLFEG